jgi:hypothetical protein
LCSSNDRLKYVAFQDTAGNNNVSFTSQASHAKTPRKAQPIHCPRIRDYVSYRQQLRMEETLQTFFSP